MILALNRGVHRVQTEYMNVFCRLLNSSDVIVKSSAESSFRHLLYDTVHKLKPDWLMLTNMNRNSIKTSLPKNTRVITYIQDYCFLNVENTENDYYFGYIDILPSTINGFYASMFVDIELFRESGQNRHNPIVFAGNWGKTIDEMVKVIQKYNKFMDKIPKAILHKAVMAVKGVVYGIDARDALSAFLDSGVRQYFERYTRPEQEIIERLVIPCYLQNAFYRQQTIDWLISANIPVSLYGKDWNVPRYAKNAKYEVSELQRSIIYKNSVAGLHVSPNLGYHQRMLEMQLSGMAVLQRTPIVQEQRPYRYDEISAIYKPTLDAFKDRFLGGVDIKIPSINLPCRGCKTFSTKQELLNQIRGIYG